MAGVLVVAMVAGRAAVLEGRGVMEGRRQEAPAAARGIASSEPALRAAWCHSSTCLLGACSYASKRSRSAFSLAAANSFARWWLASRSTAASECLGLLRIK